MGDLHLMIIDDVGEVIGRESVRFDQDRLIQHIHIKFDAAVDFVIKIGFADAVDGLADDIGLTGSHSCLGFFQ